jgi:hypothetical protein
MGPGAPSHSGALPCVKFCSLASHSEKVAVAQCHGWSSQPPSMGMTYALACTQRTLFISPPRRYRAKGSSRSLASAAARSTPAAARCHDSGRLASPPRTGSVMATSASHGSASMREAWSSGPHRRPKKGTLIGLSVCAFMRGFLYHSSGRFGRLNGPVYAQPSCRSK